MILVNFKKVNNVYESNLKYFDNEACEHKAQYTIEKNGKIWVIKKEGELLEHNFSKLNDAKQYVQKLYYNVNASDEIEEGLMEGGGYTPGACITADGKGHEYMCRG